MLSEAHRSLVGGTFLFQHAPSEAVELAFSDRRARCRRVKRGEVIYTPEHFERCLGILLEGEIQVSKGALIISVLRPGALFGAAALFNDRPDYATTLTARTACSVLLLPQALVEELMARFPEVGRSYVYYLSGRIRFLNEKIETLSAGSAERRLAQYLLERQAGERVEPECSATGLARRLNVSRASLYRAFDALEALHAIRREGRSVQILDQEALRQV